MESTLYIDLSFAGGQTGWLLVERGTVAAVGHTAPVLPPGGNVASLEGVTIAAAVADIHSHGGAGSSYDDADEPELEGALEFHRRCGTTESMVSLVSARLPALSRRLCWLHERLATRTGVLGVHLEGPFLASTRCGAHDPAALMEPSPEAVDLLLESGQGSLRMVTLAPELPGALDAVDRFVDAGVTVAVGHTNATYDEAAAAFDRGARVITHAFNAMPGLQNRSPGPIAAALDRDHVTLELIADGVHVHNSLIRLLFSSASGRVALVTDSMAATGVGDGTYQVGALEVEVHNGVARLAETETLAGSTLTQETAVVNVVSAGVGARDAVDAVAVAPYRALDMPVPRIRRGVRVAELRAFDRAGRRMTIDNTPTSSPRAASLRAPDREPRSR